MADVETSEYSKALRRMISSYCERVADADDADLADAIAVFDEFRSGLGRAAERQSWRHGWAYVGRGLGMSSQGARQKFLRWAHKS